LALLFRFSCLGLKVWYNKHGTLPTVEELEDVWTLPAETDDNYQYKKELLLWYCDEYLPMAAGHDNFGPSIRNYKMLVDKRTVAGEDRICVTIPSEAFGWVVMANCRSKWLAVLELRKHNSDAKIPAYDDQDPNTAIYHTTLWSDSKSGQIKGGGWDPEAYKRFNKYMTNIHHFRTEDQKAEWKMHLFAKDLVRELHGITAVAKTSKRKRQNKEAKGELVYDTILQFSDT
jgi:hypothetical protein